MEAGTLDVADFDISIKKGPRRMTTAAPPATVANKTPKNAMIDKILQPPGSHSSSNKRKGLHEKEVRKEKNKYKNIGAKEDEGRERCRADAGASRAIFFPFPPPVALVGRGLRLFSPGAVLSAYPPDEFS